MFLFKVDGCTNYTVLRQAGHSEKGALQDTKQCHRKDLLTGWYRLQGAVGNRITDNCVSKRHSGVEYQGWLNDSHPTATEGAVARKVCFSGNNSCRCLWRNLIKVKNCSFYYVYELHENSTYHLRHCGNAGAGK